MEQKRGSFTGGLGFVLAAAGSAVGLGNLWRFPYLAAQYGGGIFILVYIILALTFGFALMTTEIAIGRKTKSSPITAYSKLDKRFGFLGIIASIVPVIILPYYCVIGGWVTKYVTTFAQGLGKPAASDGYFQAFTGDTFSPLFFFMVFLIFTTLIVMAGVEKGIENVSKFLMPLLVLLTAGIAFQNWNNRLTWGGVGRAAMGQMFYSMSLAMGIMITYGSYTKDEISLSKSVNQIEIFDTIISLLAGLLVIPAVYIFSGEAGLKSSGAGLMFITLPKVFDQMPKGELIGFLFFALVLFAALTSSVSIMEAIVSAIMDKFRLSRNKSCAICIIIAIILGVPSSLGNGAWSNITILGMDFLTFFDYISNSLLMPFVALCTAILAGWILGPKVITDEVTRNGEKFGRKKLYGVMIKYVAPVLLIIILITYTLSQFGLFTM